MRALFLTTRLPHPPWRGDQVRSWNLLRHMAGRHDITVASITVGRPAGGDVAAVEGLGVKVEPIPVSRVGSIPAVARGMFRSTPFQVLLYDRRSARRHLRRILEEGAFDLVHSQLARTAPYLPTDGPPVVVDLIDALSANFAKRATYDRVPLKWAAAIEARRLDRYETDVLEAADAAIVVSSDDRDALGDPTVHVIPNGVDLDAFRFQPSSANPNRVVFAGALGYFPNVDAAEFLAREVMPLIREQRPDATLHLVGASPARAVRALADGDRVVLHADVPDIAPHVAASAVTVIPMRAGSGMQNKIVEAMALGTPVVTTPQAARAVGAVHGEHLLVAREPRNIAVEALAVMGDEREASRIAARARRLVEDRFRWEMTADAVDGLWHRAAAR